MGERDQREPVGATGGEHSGEALGGGAVQYLADRYGAAGAQRVIQRRATQRKARAETAADMQASAELGTSGAGGPLPHLETIQKSFGGHDVSHVAAHTDGAARAGATAMGAEAFASGDHVAFAGTPSLHTAAHEAAHVVQQRAGVHLKGGVGESGDRYEQHADAVADKVVRGESAAALLSSVTGTPAIAGGGGGAVQHKAIQLLGTPLDQALPSGAVAPQYGETTGVQRRYSVEQYVEMWEKEQGRKATADEKATIERGCIGITANNLEGGGNPLDFAEGTYGTFDQAHAMMKKKNDVLDTMAMIPLIGAMVPKSRYVLFAKLFWSNQSDDFDARKSGDPNAFKPDPKTGEVDMSGYKYKARTKPDGKGTFVNFDYGFWDETSQCFWHANHMRYKDPQKNADNPMEVYQSTKEKFVKGYIDFDRIVFAIAKADNYNPGLAAINHAGGTP